MVAKKEREDKDELSLSMGDGDFVPNERGISR